MPNKYDGRKVVVYHNKVVINDYNLGDMQLIENMFDVYNKGNFTFSTVGAFHNNEDKTFTLPRGINIQTLKNLTEKNPYYEDFYNKPTNVSENILLKFPPRDDKQKQAIDFLTGNGNYGFTRNYNQLYLALNTGAGKTYLGIVYTAILGLKTIIIASSVHWLEQWKNAFLQHSNIYPNKMKMISGSAMIRGIMIDNNPPDEDVFFITHDTITAYANQEGWDSIDAFLIKLGVGLKIIDEAHLNFDSLYKLDYASPIYKTLYLSATPVRGGEDNKAYQAYFDRVPMLSLFDPDSDPHTHYIALLYKSGMTALEQGECGNSYGFNKQIYCDKLVLKENFDYICRIVMDMISNIPGKKIFFLATNNAIVFFYNWLRYNYTELASDIGIFTSINPNKQEALNNTIILTTSKSAGACLDIENLTVCINLAEPTKSPPQNQQRFGRTRSYNSFFIDVVDVGVGICKKYYKASLPMYDKYALDTKEVIFNKTNLKNTAFKVMEKRLRLYGGLPFERIDTNKNKVWW